MGFFEQPFKYSIIDMYHKYSTLNLDRYNYTHSKCLQGITGDMQGKSAISMEKGCKNHRETLYSSKGRIAYIVEKPCNIYRLRGNPMIIIEFPRNL